MHVTFSSAGRVLALLLIYPLFPPQAALAQLGAQYSTVPNGVNDPEADAQRLLLHARTVFVTLDGSDSHFPRSPMESEQLFTQSLTAWGRYQLAPDTQHADVVLRLRPSVHVSVIDSSDNTGSTIDYTPYYRLTIADPATLKPLWNVTVPVRIGTRKKDHADLFALSTQNLTSQLKLLVGEQLSPTELANNRSLEQTRHASKAWIILPVALIAAPVGAAVYMHMKFDADVQKQKDDLCKQNAFFCNTARTGTAR